MSVSQQVAVQGFPVLSAGICQSIIESLTSADSVSLSSIDTMHQMLTIGDL